MIAVHTVVKQTAAQKSGEVVLTIWARLLAHNGAFEIKNTLFGCNFVYHKLKSIA